MKIRWYHWLVYKLYYKVWGPILATRPDMVKLLHSYSAAWIAQHEQQIQDRRAKFSVVPTTDIVQKQNDINENA